MLVGMMDPLLAAKQGCVFGSKRRGQGIEFHSMMEHPSVDGRMLISRVRRRTQCLPGWLSDAFRISNDGIVHQGAAASQDS